MKTTKLFLMFLIVGMYGCEKEVTLDCVPASLQGDVIAFYPFNNGQLIDESSNNNDMTNPTTATATSDRMGNSNCAYQFVDSPTNEEYLTTTSSNFLDNLDEFSISIWYEPLDTARNGGSYEILFSRGDEARCPDRRGEWSVGLYDCRSAVFGHNNSVWAESTINNCQERINMLTNKWHHVVAIKDNNEYKIYFNGNLDETATGNANCSSTTHLAQNIGDAFIGKYFTGKIDDVIIFDKALSQSDVTNLFELEACCE